MGHAQNKQRTFALKLYLHCKGCAKKVEKFVKDIEGVDSVHIDKDLELGKVTISGNVNPETVIKMLKAYKGGKHADAELLGKEEEEEGGESPPEIKHQEMQIVLQQNPVRTFLDQRKVAPVLPGVMIRTNVDKQMEKETLDCTKQGHELEQKYFNKPFKCDRCREEGFTWGYRCKHCIYDIHKDCRNPIPEVTHDFFQGCTFIFSQKLGYHCDACGLEIHGHSYGCRAKNLDLHPACSKLPGKVCIGGTDFVLCKKVKYECFWCKEEKPSWLKVPGLWYVSEPNKFSCHVHCVSRVMQEAWKRGDFARNNGDDNDGISKALEKVDLKLEARPKGSVGNGGGLFLGAVTMFLKIIIGTLFGDPTGLIVSAFTEVIKGLLTL